MTTLNLSVASSRIIDEAYPDTNMPATSGIMTLKPTVSGLLYVPGLPRTGSVTSAILRLEGDFGWDLMSNKTLSIFRLKSPWDANSVTWNTPPSVGSDEGTDYINFVGPLSANIEADITSMVQAYIDEGLPPYGFMLVTDQSELKVYDYISGGTHNPTLDVTWYETPQPATNLSPSDDQQVSKPMPRLQWVASDQAAYHVEVDFASTFDTNKLVDTGWVVSGNRYLDLSSLFPAWAAGSYDAGDLVQHGGEAFIALTPTSDEPSPDPTPSTPASVTWTLPTTQTRSNPYVEWTFDTLAPGDTFHIEQRAVGSDIVWEGSDESHPTANDLDAIALSFMEAQEYYDSSGDPGVVVTHEGAGVYRFTWVLVWGMAAKTMMYNPLQVAFGENYNKYKTVGDMVIESHNGDPGPIGPYNLDTEVGGYPRTQWEDPTFPANTYYGTNVGESLVMQDDTGTWTDGFIYELPIIDFTVDGYPVVEFGGDLPASYLWWPIGDPTNGWTEVDGNASMMMIGHGTLSAVSWYEFEGTDQSLTQNDLDAFVAAMTAAAPDVGLVEASQPAPGEIQFSFPEYFGLVGGLNDYNLQGIVVNPWGCTFDIEVPAALGGGSIVGVEYTADPAQVQADLLALPTWPVEASLTVSAVNAGIWSFSVTGITLTDTDLWSFTNISDSGVADPTVFGPTGLLFGDVLDWRGFGAPFELFVDDFNPTGWIETAKLTQDDWVGVDGVDGNAVAWQLWLPDGESAFWRVSYRNIGGKETTPTTATFGRTDKGALALVSPTDEVVTSSPKVEWSLTGKTQASYAVEIQKKQDTGAYAPIWRSGWVTSAANVVYPPIGTLWDYTTEAYRVSVYLRDTVSRVNVTSDPDVYSVSQLFTMLPSLYPPAPATDLVATVQPPNAVRLTWKSNITPAFWRIWQQGQVYNMVSGESLWLGSENYGITIAGRTASATWGIEAIAYTGDLADTIPTDVAEIPIPVGVWLTALDGTSNPTSVMIAGKNPIKMTHNDDPQIQFGIGAPASMTRSAPRGRSGSISGTVLREDYEKLYEIYCIGKASISFGGLQISSALVIDMEYSADPSGEDEVSINFQERAATGV